MIEFSDEIMKFIQGSNWIFAKTYAKTWPHEYIDNYGYQSKFYNQLTTYFDYDGYTYWHMENIINRCLEKDTYRVREKENRLPK